jgi:hypothetical protein
MVVAYHIMGPTSLATEAAPEHYLELVHYFIIFDVCYHHSPQILLYIVLPKDSI